MRTTEPLLTIIEWAGANQRAGARTYRHRSPPLSEVVMSYHRRGEWSLQLLDPTRISPDTVDHANASVDPSGSATQERQA